MSKIEDLITAMERGHSEKDITKAVEMYSEAITLSPAILPLRLQRSLGFSQLKLYQEALEDLQYIIENTRCLDEVNSSVEPLFDIRADAFYYSGEIFSRSQDWNKSLGAYEENLRILNLLPKENPSRMIKKARAYFKKGLILRDKKGRVAEAITEFAESIKLSEGLMKREIKAELCTIVENHLKVSYFARACSYESLNEYENAINDYLHLGDFTGNFYIGRMYFHAGRLKEAERHLEVCMGLPDVKEKRRVFATYLLLQTRLGLQSSVLSN